MMIDLEEAEFFHHLQRLAKYILYVVVVLRRGVFLNGAHERYYFGRELRDTITVSQKDNLRFVKEQVKRLIHGLYTPPRFQKCHPEAALGTLHCFAHSLRSHLF